MQCEDCESRFFVSYSGKTLPPNLVTAIPADGLSHRNAFIRAYFDATGLLKGFDKVVYGEVELAHRYDYHGNGSLSRARILSPDEDPASLEFDEDGVRIA
jgi:hypothetical protein